ncbi:bifunctional protein-serine/threonine kinase/phosphatase [Vibrio sp. FNV 38]|nr:bifunctional protein-serine/threonine kinase/phosphatase [Vibrio sp. FNV 38]
MNSRNSLLLSKLQLKFGGASLTGQRDENQDALIVNRPETNPELIHKGVVACVADGVSCSEHSQKASHTATTQFVTDYYATPHSWGIKQSANKILTSLNTWLFEEGVKSSLAHNGLVTTFSALIVKSNTAHLFHVGDTRIYLFRNGQLRQLTRDHQRINFGRSAYLTRALGMDSALDVDYQSIAIKPNDRFFLSSDGVHDFVPHKVLIETLADQDSALEDICQRLCTVALDNKSADNLTCLLLDIVTLPDHTQLEYQQHLLSRVIPPALKEGNILDDFTVEKVLHAGTRSHVYQVINIESSQRFVLKTPSQNDGEDIAILKQFANEYWVASQLTSQRIMQMYPTPDDSQFLYALCEHIDGITLRQWMYDNPQPDLHKVREIIDDIIKALRVFQRAEMVHRDLKPENIMITPTGVIKIIDFGSVKVQGLNEITPECRESIPLGAINYIAPEYIDSGQANTLSDLFSVAVIGYEMLTGKLPYDAPQSQNIQSARHTQWVYCSINNHRDDIPQWVDLVFKKGAHPVPNRRYTVLSEFILDLYTPNQKLQKELIERSLLQRNPVEFWKLTTLLLSFIVLLQWVLLW